jgi:hypothetical protein
LREILLIRHIEQGLRLLLLQAANTKKRIRPSKRRSLRRVAEVRHAVTSLAVEPRISLISPKLGLLLPLSSLQTCLVALVL